MDRIERDTLMHLVINALRFGEKADRREMERYVALSGEAALRRVAIRVCEQIDNERRAVVQVAADPSFPFPGLDRWEG